MVHATGPRPEKIEALAREFARAISRSGCAISECQKAIHQIDEILLKGALRPLEDYMCPTCPHPEGLTPKQLDQITAAVRKIVQAGLNKGASPQ